MIKIKVFKLKPNSRFHLGKPLLDNDVSLTDTDVYPHSDVLFSALVNNLASVKGKETVDAFVNAFEEGRIKISSCFYCIESSDKSYTFLLPKPANATNQVSLDNYDEIKGVKKIQFVDSNLLGENVATWKVDGNLALSSQTLDKLKLCHKSKAASSASEIYGTDKSGQAVRLKLFSKKLNTQVGIRSLKEETYIDNDKEVKKMVSKGPYQVSYIQIADLSDIALQVHFYFAYEITDNMLEEDFELAVQLLQYNGIGGERSSGYGKIEEIETIEEVPEIFQKKTRTSLYLSLSKIIPKTSNELNCFKAYSHSVRGGRKTHEEGMLKSVRMINEGAVIAGTVDGKIADISPDQSRKYLRYGKAFLLPLPDTFCMD